MKIFLQIFFILVGVYAIICILLFFFQEKLIFFPEKLSKDQVLTFDHPFEEIHFTTADKKMLHGVLFTLSDPKGLVFYLHGNSGSVQSWGEVAKAYTDLQYDVFILDYRGFGKSEGSLTNDRQLYVDVQIAYDEMKSRYPEDKIVVLGYSIGTGPAAKIACDNSPKLLILQAPYYSLTDMMKKLYPILPTFILRYKFETNKYIMKCKMPIVIFHGDQDEVIYYNSSVKLKQVLKQTDTLITLVGQQHNGITGNPHYNIELRKLLSD
jgi:uncharacterized protein